MGNKKRKKKLSQEEVENLLTLYNALHTLSLTQDCLGKLSDNDRLAIKKDAHKNLDRSLKNLKEDKKPDVKKELQCIAEILDDKKTCLTDTDYSSLTKQSSNIFKKINSKQFLEKTKLQIKNIIDLLLNKLRLYAQNTLPSMTKPTKSTSSLASSSTASSSSSASNSTARIPSLASSSTKTLPTLSPVTNTSSFGSRTSASNLMRSRSSLFASPSNTNLEEKSKFQMGFKNFANAFWIPRMGG